MTAYTIPADLRPWVECTAPLWVDWRALERFVETWNEVGGGATTPGPHPRSHYLGIVRGRRVGIVEARALLAYRDEVARGLTTLQFRVLGKLARDEMRSLAWSPFDRDALKSQQLVVLGVDRWVLTDWGRAVLTSEQAAALTRWATARVLRKDGGR